MALHEGLPRMVARLSPRGNSSIKRLDENLLLGILNHLTAQRWLYDMVQETARRESSTGSAQGCALSSALKWNTFDSTCHSALQRKEVIEDHESLAHLLGIINIRAFAMATARAFFVAEE